MKLTWTGIVAACVAIAGCTAAGTEGSNISLKQVSPAVATRTIKMHVAGPLELATQGSLISDKGNAILTDAGAGILTDAGAGVVSAGGSNVISAGGANFRVAAASVDSFVSVGKADVQLFSMDGKPVGKAFETAADGTVEVKAKDGKPLLAVAMFKVNGKVYRLRTNLATGKLAETASVEIDPINTMVEARIRQLVGTKDTITPMTFDKLKRVWMICNSAGITVAPADLEADVAPATSLERLNKVWSDAIASKVTSQAEKDEIKAFMAEIEAIAKK
jgi:hypothetical protein